MGGVPGLGFLHSGCRYGCWFQPSVDLSPAVGPSLKLRPDSIHVGTCANTGSEYHPLSSGYSVLSEMARCLCLWIQAYFIAKNLEL